MLEYFKRKMQKIARDGIEYKDFPKYYEQDNKIIKELEDGQKFIVELDKNCKEAVVGKLK
jgi:hypothetical protein